MSCALWARIFIISRSIGVGIAAWWWPTTAEVERKAGVPVPNEVA
jgi:hypothetical protein